jgi:molecular chaperone GrpE
MLRQLLPTAESGKAEAVDTSNPNALLAKLDEVSEALVQAEQTAEDMQVRYLRAVADLENFRKRSIKEKEDLSKLAISRFVEALLPVVDNFQLGMQSADNHPEAAGISKGFEMVLEQFMEVLKTNGVEAIIPNGQEFDPQFEECVSHLPHDSVPENHVIETVRAGYKLKDRLIRPANVVVSSGPANG